MAYQYAPILITLSWLLCCSAQFTDHMQTYEENCLGEDKIHCGDGSCVWTHQYCDGKVDCPDGSDENLCPNRTTDPDLCKPESHFLCTDHSKCIPNLWLCNNETDCTDGSDELNCTVALQPAPNAECKGFKCKNDSRCISPLWVCDGNYDCADGSDEDFDACRHWEPQGTIGQHECITDHSMMFMTQKHYVCQDKRYCLAKQYMCNGMRDCKDGSDEGTFCDNWKNMCADHACSNKSKCFPEREGPECVCDDTYYFFNKTAYDCQPRNVCAEARPQCTHKCIDRKGSFLCSCDEGYLLDSLKIAFMCVAPEPEAMLFFSTLNEIKYIKIRSHKVVTVATGIKQAHGVSFDGTNVYWVETAQGHQTIVRAPLDNIADTKTVLVGLGLEDPGDISIDWMGRNFYFSDAERGTISACKLDGQMCVTIKTAARVPKHLTLDVKNRKMYWADLHEGPVIMQAYMDGSDPVALVVDLHTFPNGLVVDSSGSRLYFSDGTVKGARLDTGEVFVVNEHGIHYHQPYALTVFEHVIYWSDWATDTIQSWDKLNTHSRGAVLSLDTPVLGLYMYHPIMHRSAPEPDAISPHHIRLLGPDGPKAVCPEGMVLDDMDKCEPLPSYRPGYIVVGVDSLFTLVQYDSLGGHTDAPVHLDIGRVQAMTYDTNRDVLYIYDAKWKTIYSIPMSEFHTGKPTIFLFMGLNDVVDMDYDYVTDNLYLADAGRKILEVVSLKTGKRAVIHRFEHETPISVCVVPDYGKILVAVSETEENENIHIDIFGLDGSGRQHLLMNNLKGPNIRMKYSQKMDNVFISDEGNNIIDYMHPLGTARENYRSLSTSVTQLEVTDNLVVWSTRRSHRLYWADIHDTSRSIRRAELSMFPNTTYLHLKVTWKPPNSTHPCVQQNMPCSDVCVQTPTNTSNIVNITTVSPLPNYKCLCPPGMVVVDRNCTELVSCQEDELLCHQSNSCILKTGICDGKNDCKYGEDEEDCPNSAAKPPKCSSEEKLCDDMCILKSIPCFLPTTTSPGITTTTEADLCNLTLEFSCSEGHCVPRSLMCDGKTDCPDGLDEARHICDTHTCMDHEFMCSSGTCILKAFVCDGEADCNDESDEVHCNDRTCAAGEFQCHNGLCVEMTRRCDGQQDCNDGSDENNCQPPSIDPDYFWGDNSTQEPELENCEEWEYTCELNRSICLPLTSRCNHKPDCPGATDEVDCVRPCPFEGSMRCRLEPYKCVSAHRVCDGIWNCVDGEDETPEICNKVNKTSKLYPIQIAIPTEECHDGYHCNNGRCIEWMSVCDNQVDCADGSDEDGECSTACLNNNCSYVCKPTPAGAHCRCPNGYNVESDGACTDRDECALEECSQHCYNTPGSFLCTCHKGYALRLDHRSCKAVGGNMSILFMSGNTVRSFSMEGQFATEYKDNDTRITSMDYDVLRNKLYLTAPDDGKVTVVDATHNLVDISNVGLPSRVALDWVTGNIYFADLNPLNPRMRVCNLQKKRCAVLQKLPLHSNVPALVIDPASRKLFYSVSRDLESVIWSCSMAGRHVTQVAVGGNCTGLAVDSFKKRLYIAETGPARIIAVDYNGHMLKDILTDDRHLQFPHDLAIFEDHIYYLDGKTSKLHRCVLFGKKHCEIYLHRLFDLKSFMIRHPSVQRNDLPDYCADIRCNNICVLGDLDAICVCDDGAISKDSSCPLPSKFHLPLFNGVAAQGFERYPVPKGVIITLSILLVVWVAGLAYYFFIHKRNRRLCPTREAEVDYTQVTFQNSSAEGTSGFGEPSSPPVEPSVHMPTIDASTSEYVNPLQFFRNFNWRQFRRNPRPIGTSEIQFNVPEEILDVSDTESDLDDRENKKIVKNLNN